MSRIETIASALCNGIAIQEVDREAASQAFRIKSDFVSGSIFLFEGRKPINTICIHDDQHPDAPRLSSSSNDKWTLSYKQKDFDVRPMYQPPEILTGRLPNLRATGDFFEMHSPRTLFVTPIRECVFISQGEKCGFCTFDEGIPQSLPPRMIAQKYNQISLELGFRPSVALGPGTPNKRDHGARYFSNVIRALKGEGCQNISAELVPPHAVSDIDQLIEEGCGSVISSIEIWDDISRHQSIPGKSYISKSHYIEFWKYVVERLGRGRVSTVFIVGLEPMSSLKKGIEEVTRLGVVPTLIPYRKYERSQIDAHFSPTVEEYLDVSRFCAHAMADSRIHPLMQVGCTPCGGCSIDSDLVRAKASNSSNIIA